MSKRTSSPLTEPFAPFSSPTNNEEQLASLARAINYAKEFVLLVALCNDNDLRRELMGRLRELLPGKTVQEMPLFENVESLYHRMAEEFGGPEAKPPHVCMVYGLEAWLPAGDESETSPFVRNLNAARNHFPRLFSGALVLWLSDHLLTAVARGAPDFCSVRSGTYLFAASPKERLETAGLLQVLGLDGVAGLSIEEKRRRAEDLESMLNEMERQPESERDAGRYRRLLEAAVETYFTLAEYPKAEPLLRRAVQSDEKSYGPDHPKVATGLNNLAALLQETNRLSKAEPFMRRALAIDEKSYGPDHPTVARDLNNLATLLYTTNRLSEAEPLMRRALEINENSVGPDYPKVAAALNNLAQLLKTTNRLSEAEPLYRRALDIYEKSLGPDHPKVATTLNNLAELLRDTNRLSETEPLYRRALDIWEKSVGSEHPHVASCLNNLALLLRDTNRLSEAEPLHQRALEIVEKSYGPDHPEVAIHLNNLAELLQATDRLSEAEPLYRRAVQIDEKSYGPHHPNVARDLNNLAGLFYTTNRLSKAEPLLRRALAIFQASYGPDHPHTQTTQKNLDILLEELGKQ